jgi:hypothetical protein
MTFLGLGWFGLIGLDGINKAPQRIVALRKVDRRVISF